jgi:large subunit ribosomal protein L4
MEKTLNKNSLKIHDIAGKEVGSYALSEKIFSVEINQAVFSQAIVSYLANQRAPIANTKTRGQVSGGGRKPFKQKGTGNARAGSSRSPLWIGGGITFGPKNNRNFKKRIPQKVNQAAIKMILSDKAKNNRIILLDNFKLDKISTKQVYEIFSHLPIEEGKILVILPKIEVTTELSMSNIPYVKVIKIDNLNVYDLAKHDYLLTTKEAIEKIQKEVLQ